MLGGILLPTSLSLPWIRLLYYFCLLCLISSNRLLAGTGAIMDSGEYSPKSNGECSEKINEVSPVKCAFAIFDADFFNDTKIAEIEQGATELNIPISGANRKLVASVNGGLHDPSYLVFNSEWGNEQVQSKTKRFSCPSLSGIQRPEGEEDIAFMTVLELGELIKTKQITSEQLTRIFLHRLKR
ncbi:uncharacterized protein LOC117932505 [Vitis riparia]|uniref:uncharacterized protein LOC117932505 n=1 Tax=Vitis riparia TaxID=96939 RepID=UPI00155B1F11|nr:uncharacterized protein LOC117932505 [Vitis riparia]